MAQAWFGSSLELQGHADPNVNSVPASWLATDPENTKELNRLRRELEARRTEIIAQHRSTSDGLESREVEVHASQVLDPISTVTAQLKQIDIPHFGFA